MNCLRVRGNRHRWLYQLVEKDNALPVDDPDIDDVVEPEANSSCLGIQEEYVWSADDRSRPQQRV